MGATQTADATAAKYNWAASFTGLDPKKPNGGVQRGTAPAAKPATGAGEAPAVGLGAASFVLDAPPVEKTFVYAKVTATAKFSVSYALVEVGDPGILLKFKNLQPQIETAIKKKLASGATLKGSSSIEDAKGSVGAELEFEGCSTAVKHAFGFEILKLDANKGKVQFADLKWGSSVKLIERTIEVDGAKVKFSGSIAVGLGVGPDWKAIAQYAAKRLGIMVAEEAAAGAAAGGTGTAGAAAIASAPVAGILGGIVGGVALAAGVCASIGKLEDFGKDCMAVCEQGQRELRAYAESYGSAMRGKPGSNKHGNDDAESALREIMAKTPGMTREQAVQAAIASKQDYENLAFRRLLPVVRAQVERTYREEKGPIGWFFSSDTLGQMMKHFLGENDHY